MKNGVIFQEFVGGGAGVGKSTLIKAIYQCITRRFNGIPNSNPNQAKVLLGAPTAKAAFAIGGPTLHLHPSQTHIFASHANT